MLPDRCVSVTYLPAATAFYFATEYSMRVSLVRFWI